MNDQGNLERTWKVREKSGNLKIKGYGNHRKFIILLKRGKGYILMRKSKPISLLIGGYS